MERGKCHGSALWRGAIEVTDFAGEKLYHFRGLPSFSERNDERCYLGQPEEDLKDRERKEQRSYTSSTQDHVEILEDHNLFFPRILKTGTISATAARRPPPVSHVALNERSAIPNTFAEKPNDLTPVRLAFHPVNGYHS